MSENTRACALCSEPIAPTKRRHAIYCSRRCCQRACMASRSPSAEERARKLERQRESRRLNRVQVKQKRHEEYLRNKEIVRAQVATWQSDNRQRFLEIGRRRRVRKAESGVFAIAPKDLRRLQMERFCFYCREIIALRHIDHRVPIARGGRHSIGNLVASCAPCNWSKNDSFIVEWGRRPSWQ